MNRDEETVAKYDSIHQATIELINSKYQTN